MLRDQMLKTQQFQKMEIPSILGKSNAQKHPTVISRFPYILLHANEDTTYLLELGNVYDIRDVLDSSAAWFKKNSILLKMKFGDTHLLALGNPTAQN